METLSMREWAKYRDRLKRISQKAADEFRDAVFMKDGKWGGVGLGEIPRDELLDYGYALATKYGEGAAAVACQFYDEVAEASEVLVPSAEPAPTATYHETAKAINGSIKQSPAGQLLESTMYRLVKQAAADTTLQNAIRDRAEFAWIPSGDTCAFCLTLASNGWQEASRSVMEGNHAQHIHANCDCQFAIRFNKRGGVAGYDPEKYRRMYEEANTDTEGKVTIQRDEDGNLREYRQTKSDAKINAMRRKFYAQDKEAINANKRMRYADRKAMESELYIPKDNK